MAYTNPEANDLVSYLSNEHSVDLAEAMAIAYVLTNDEEAFSNVDDTQMEGVAEAALSLGNRLLDIAQAIEEGL